jgi:hypothetical protein
MPRILGFSVGLVCFMFFWLDGVTMPVLPTPMESAVAFGVTAFLAIAFGIVFYLMVAKVLSTVYGRLKWEYPRPPLF